MVSFNSVLGDKILSVLHGVVLHLETHSSFGTLLDPAPLLNIHKAAVANSTHDQFHLMHQIKALPTRYSNPCPSHI